MSGIKKKSKNPPIFSHEFIITNHGDIVSMVAMVFIAGMLFQGTAKIASLFVSMQHNVTQESKKISKRLHLPRFMQSKYNESGQYLFFYVFSVYWAVYAMINERFITGLSDLWSEYPHAILPFWIKVFFVFQISYWLHNFPELYFQKVKRNEIPSKVFFSSLFLVGLFAGYFMNFSKLTMIILILHYTTDSFFHLARLMKFYGYTSVVQASFTIYNGLYVVSRSLCCVLAFLTFYYGLPQYSVPTLDIAAGNFNTWLIRLNCMAFVFLTEAYMVWAFVNYHLAKMRERKSQVHTSNIYSASIANSNNHSNDVQRRKNQKKEAKESPSHGNNGIKQQKKQVKAQ